MKHFIFLFLIISQLISSLEIEAQSLQTTTRNLWFLRVLINGDLQPVKINVTIPVSANPLLDVLNILFLGLTESEKQQGITSFIPADTSVLSTAIRGNTAYINFNNNFQYNTFGIEGYLAQIRQIVLTVTEFQNINDVQILIEGRRIDYLGNRDVWIGSPLSPTSFPTGNPALVIERSIEEHERLVAFGNSSLFIVRERSINDIQGIITEKSMPIGNNIYLIKNIQNNISTYFIRAEHSGSFSRYINEIQIKIDDQLFTLKDTDPSRGTLFGMIIETATVQLPLEAVNLLRSCDIIITQINGRSKGQPVTIANQGINIINMFFQD